MLEFVSLGIVGNLEGEDVLVLVDGLDLGGVSLVSRDSCLKGFHID